MPTDKAEGISWQLFLYWIHWDKNQILGHSVEVPHTFAAATEKPQLSSIYVREAMRNLWSNWTIPMY